MRYFRTAYVTALAILLLTCTSCRTEDIDQDGDGQVNTRELLSAAFNYVCGEPAEPEAPGDETPDDETPDDRTESDEESESDL